jgi:cytochrome c biogenesis protein CcdA
MKLSLKQKALLITVGLFVLAAVAGSVVGFIVANVSTQTIINALAIGFFVFFGWVFYGVTLSQLEYKEKLKEMVEKKG